MVFRNNKAHLLVAFEDGAKFHRLEPNSTVQWTVEGEIKNKKIEKRRPTTVVTGPGGGPGDIPWDAQFRILNFFLFFPLNWAVELETGRLNLRLDSLVVPYWTQKRARVAKKRPILCNMTVWFSSGSFFKRISVFAYYFSAHSESREWWTWYFENWKKARLTEYKIRPWI